MQKAPLWQRYPFIRIILPFLPGLLVGNFAYDVFPRAAFPAFCFLCLVILLCLLILPFWRKNRLTPLPSKNAQVLWGLILFLFLFFFGTWRAYDAQKKLENLWLTSEQSIGSVVITSQQSTSNRSISFQATLTSGFNRPPKTTCNLLITFPRYEQMENLQPGDVLIFKGILQSPKNRGNPEEFNYAAYLRNKGIAARAYIPPKNILGIRNYSGYNRSLSCLSNLRIKALRIRAALLHRCRAAGLRDDAFALFSALTTGDKSALNKDLKSLYSETGTMHLLALSGMHLGILTILLTLIVRRLFLHRWLKAASILLIIFLVWSYTLFAGLPTSLCRAAAMYSLMLCGSLLNRSGFSINSLCCTAFAMLSLNPLYLYDVGFQLSFLSMLGILIICPHFQNTLTKIRFVRWIVGSILVSISAQLFTIPLTAYKFGTFAPYSALSTLLVTPFTALLIYMLPLLAASTYFNIGTTPLITLVQLTANCQNNILRSISQWPCTLIHTDCSLWLVILYYLVLATLLFIRHKKLITELKQALAVTIVLVLAANIDSRLNQVKPQLIFYNNSACPAVHLIRSSRLSYLIPAAADSSLQSLSYIAETFWMKKLKASPHIVTNNFADGNIVCSHGLVRCKSAPSFLILNDNFWNNKISSSQAQVDYILICKGFSGNLTWLALLFRPRCVILDSSLYSYKKEIFKKDCAALQWDYYDIASEGALIIPLK